MYLWVLGAPIRISLCHVLQVTRELISLHIRKHSSAVSSASQVSFHRAKCQLTIRRVLTSRSVSAMGFVRFRCLGMKPLDLPPMSRAFHVPSQQLCVILTANYPEVFFQVIDELLKKMENHATAEAIRLRKPTHGRLRLIGTAIGVLVVVLLALWMAYH
jgi:hypothetical protein